MGALLTHALAAAEGKDEKNKSQIASGSADEYREKKGIPAGRPGADTDMAQTALFIACNQYLYGQVSLQKSDIHVM